MEEPTTRLRLEAPGGLVEVLAVCRNGKAEKITITNVPSYADRLGEKLEVEGVGTLTVDTAYGGDSFVIVDAAALGFEIVPDEARDLAIVLRAGALPAPVKILEERTVGPSLGKDSIEKGFKSMIIGGLVVIVFMFIYYSLSGIIADLALLLNILFIMAGLAFFGATLTLPGIAGIILTIGMCVDANVLIFERIREELRLGKPTRAAIEGGYSKALVTILDANVTTFIAALVLFQFGTGPVRGFAVTLSIGIVASFVTAVFITRVIFDYLFIYRKWKKIRI